MAPRFGIQTTLTWHRRRLHVLHWIGACAFLLFVVKAFIIEHSKLDRDSSDAFVLASTLHQAPQVDTVLLIIASKRAEYLRRCLASIGKYIPHELPWLIIISEDGADRAVAVEVDKFAENAQHHRILHIHHAPRSKTDTDGYHRLSQHYKWALDQVRSSCHLFVRSKRV